MSKFGAHITLGKHDGLGTAMKKCADAGSPIPVLLGVDQNLWADVQQYSPKTLLAFRTQIDENSNPPGIWQGAPVKVADDYYDLRKPMWMKNPAHIYVPCNEMDAATLEQFDWQNVFDLRMMQRATADGLRLGVGVHSTGTPSDFPVNVDKMLFAAKRKSIAAYKRAMASATRSYGVDLKLQAAGAAFDLPRFGKWERLIPSMQYAKKNRHVLLVHEYGFGTTFPESAPWHALRYRSALDYLAQFDADPQVIIGECSDYCGYSGEGAVWLRGVEWYDQQVIGDPRVLGFCAYQLGMAENWWQLIPQWADYVAAHPTPVNPIEPPDPPRVYERVCRLVPPSVQIDTNDPRLRAIVKDAGPGRNSIFASADDAFAVVPNCTRRTVYVYNVAEWGGKESLEAWAAKWYSPLPEIIYKELN